MPLFKKDGPPQRLHSVYFKTVLKLTNSDIGKLCSLSRQSVSTWIKVYIKLGIKALYLVNYGTNTSELLKYQTTLVDSLEKVPVASLAEAKARIEKLTNIKRSLTSVATFLKSQGFRFRKLGHIPAKADIENQSKWLKDVLNPAIEAAKEGKIHLLFMDAAHFVLGPYICCLWTLVRLFIKAPAGRQRLNIIGVVDGITKKILYQYNDSFVNSQTLCEFLKYLKEKMPDKPISIVLDNARYQHCLLVMNLALELNITLLFLTPYSPNLNIIERLWKLVKKKVLYAKYYENFELFKNAIINCMDRNDQEFKNECHSLLTLKFQTFENVKIYPF